MIKWKHLKSIIITLLISLLAPVLLVAFRIINILDVCKMINSISDIFSFQFNIIQFCATICGFTITSVSILISTLESERIKRLWNYGYLDIMYLNAFICIITSILTIIIGFGCMFNVLNFEYFIFVQIFLIIILILFFFIIC